MAVHLVQPGVIPLQRCCRRRSVISWDELDYESEGGGQIVAGDYPDKTWRNRLFCIFISWFFSSFRELKTLEHVLFQRLKQPAVGCRRRRRITGLIDGMIETFGVKSDALLLFHSLFGQNKALKLTVKWSSMLLWRRHLLKTDLMPVIQ